MTNFDFLKTEPKFKSFADVAVSAEKILLIDYAALREELTTRREAQLQTYIPKPLDISEYKTRKIYIDSMLEDAGWIER